MTFKLGKLGCYPSLLNDNTRIQGVIRHCLVLDSQPPPPPPRLLDQVRQAIRLKHFSLKTKKSYVYYIRDFILFHGKRHPKDMGADEIWAYLAHLAVERSVAASMQTVALSALLFLYRQVLQGDPPFCYRDSWSAVQILGQPNFLEMDGFIEMAGLWSRFCCNPPLQQFWVFLSSDALEFITNLAEERSPGFNISGSLNTLR